MQQKIPINNGWLYKDAFIPGDDMCSADEAGFETVDLPHTNQVLPYNCFDERSYQFVSCYKKIFPLPEELEGKRVFLEFEGVMTACEVWCNGIAAGGHKGGYTPFSIDLTSAAKPGADNVVVVKVDSTERADIPPFGGVVDFLTYGGIYREAWLRISDATRIERLWLSSPDPLAEGKTLVCGCEITAEDECEATVKVTLAGPDKGVVGQIEKQLTLVTGTHRYEITIDELHGIALWDLDSPVLYTATAALAYGESTDSAAAHFGFRKAEFTPGGFFLNDRLVKLIGLNRHQSWPYVGYAMPERIQRKDAEIIKIQAGCNVVRTSHYPQSRHFLDACDELGLLVIEELPGWQHIGNLAWQDQAVKDVEDMITRDFNHPSIILWGVRINESQDCHDFYARTNELSRRMDPCRQTGGTRYIQRSEFLEDVYTYNDFTHNGGKAVFRPQRETTGLEYDVPTMVTESNGHMYPTKRFDQESRVVEHAFRHLRIINESIGREDLCGGASWCAFDYNTHGCFGSGDKICYHGVYDMFRNPKYAAFAYASQKDPGQGIVMEPITAAARGERDGGGTVPFYVLTNCDQVRVYKNGAFVDDFFPERETYPHLPHPPVLMTHLMEKEMDFGFSAEDTEKFRTFLTRKLRTGGLTSMNQEDMLYLGGLAKQYNLSPNYFIGVVIRSAGGWGDAENTLQLEGLVDGQVVCRREIGERKYEVGLTAVPDDGVLLCGGDTYDATRVTVKVVDNMGNIMPFSQECVEISMEGPVKLMGPYRVPVTGGMVSFWVRTVGEPGTARITVKGVYAEAECTVLIQ